MKESTFAAFPLRHFGMHLLGAKMEMRKCQIGPATAVLSTTIADKLRDAKKR
jgi:hypothetical protein